MFFKTVFYFMGQKKCQKCPNELEALVLLAEVWTLLRHF